MNNVTEQIRIVNENSLIIPGHLPEEEAFAALAEMEGPLAAMVKDETRFDLGPYQGLRLLKHEFSPRHVLVENDPHTLIRLNLAESRVYSAWRQQDNERYDWALFLAKYQEDCEKVAARIWHKALRSHPHEGIYGQANTDPRLKPGQVGLNPQCFYELLKKYYPQFLFQHGITSIRQLRGLDLTPLTILVRYPVADCVLLARPVVLWDRPARKIYWHWHDLYVKAGGDEDGDGCANSKPSRIFAEDIVGLRHETVFPQPVVVKDGNGPVFELLVEKRMKADRARLETGVTLDDQMLELVMGMCVKEFTGTLTYVFWIWERLAAERAIGGVQTDEDRAVVNFALAQRQYRGVASLYSPLLEKVMDAGKPDSKIPREKLERLVRALDTYMGGKTHLEARELTEAFEPFLNGEQLGKLAAVLRGIGTRFADVRTTAGGRLIAAGSGNEAQGRAIGKIFRKMTGEDPVPGNAVLDFLYNDVFCMETYALGKKSWEKRKQPGKTGARELDEEQELPQAPGTSELAWNPSAKARTAVGRIVTGLEYQGKPLFARVVEEKLENGMVRIQALLLAHWAGADRAGNLFCYPVSFLLPSLKQVGSWGQGSFRHCAVKFEGRPEVLFRPVFRIGEDYIVAQVGVVQSLAEQLVEVLQPLIGRRLSWRTDNPENRKKISELLSSRIQFDLTKRVCDTLAPTSMAFNYVHQHKVSLEIPQFPGEKDTLRDWDYKRALLRWVKEQRHEDGRPVFGIGYTAKDAGKIGTEAAILDECGFPEYAVEWDPMIHWADGNPKRWAEYQYTDPQDLARPVPFPVTAKGFTRPDVLQLGETTLTCALISVEGANVYLDEASEVQNQDTCAFTWAGARALQLAHSTRWFKTEEEAEAYLDEELCHDPTLTLEQVEIEDRWTEFAPGIKGITILVRIYRPVNDNGKAKSVAPFKGVLNVIPTRYFYERDGVRHEIHCLLPRHTALKKNALNAVLLGLAARAGIEELDPQMPLAEVAGLVREGLRKKGLHPEGLETIQWSDDQGNTGELGEATVLLLPWYRPAQTEESTHSLKDGIKLDLATQILAGRPVDQDCETYQKARLEMADVFTTWKDINSRIVAEESYGSVRSN